MLVTVYVPVGYLKILIGLVLTFIPTLIYQARNDLKVFIAVAMFVIGSIAEGIAGFLVIVFGNAELDNLLEYQRIQGVLIGRSLVFIITQLMGYFAKKWPVRVSGKGLMGFMILPLATIICIFKIVNNAYTSMLSSVLAAALLIFSNVFVFYLFMKQVRIENEYAKIDFLRLQIENMGRHYKELYRSYRNMAKLRHDQKNFLLSLSSMVNAGNIEQVRLIIQQTLGDLAKDPDVISTGNYVIDSILDAKRQAGPNIHWTYEIANLSGKNVEIFDVAMLVATLLDNAIESQTGELKPWISVVIRQTSQFLMIQVSNGFDGILNYDGKRIVTRKQDKNNHGFGLQTIEQIVNKYEGTMEIICSNKQFTVNCILQKN